MATTGHKTLRTGASLALGAFLVATAILIVPGAQAVDIGKPTLYNQGGQDPEYSRGVTIEVTFNSPDLVSLAGLVLHFDCSASGEFSEAMAISIGAASPHAILVGIDDTTQNGYGYNQAEQSGYGYVAGQGHGVPTGNRDPVDLGGYGYSSGNGYSYGYDSGYGYGYTSGTLTFSFEWIQSAFVALEECTLVLEVVPKGRTTGDFESPRSDVFIPRVPPLADAGENLVSVPGATVTLDGSLSVDPNDGPGEMFFEWEQQAGVAVSGLTGNDTDAPQFVVPAALDTAITFALTVNDTLDADSDEVQVDIRLVAAPQDFSVLESTPLQLSAQAANFPGLTYLWRVVSGPPVAFADPTALQANIVLPEVDADTPVRLNVTASNGSLVGWDEVTILVRDNEAPVVDAGVETVLYGGSVVAALAGASATDPDPLATRTVLWTTSSSLITIGNPTSLTPSLAVGNSDTVQTATLVLTATDQEGAVGKDVRHLIILPNTVKANAGPDLGVLEGQTLVVDGNASRNATSFAWTALTAGAPAPSPADQSWFSFTAPGVSETTTYEYQLRVNGPNGPTDRVNITVVNSVAGGGNTWWLHTTGCLIADVAGLPLEPSNSATTANTAGDNACVRPAVPLLTPTVDFPAAAPATDIPAGQVAGTLYLSVLLPDSQAPLLPVPPLDGVRVDVDIVQGTTVIGSTTTRATVDTVAFGIEVARLPSTLPGLPLNYRAVPITINAAPIDGDQPFTFRVRVAPTIPGLVYVIGLEGTTASSFVLPGGGSGGSGSPVADAGAPAAYPEGVQGIELDATGSTGATSFAWTQVGGVHVQLADANTASPTFNAPPVASDQVLTFRVVARNAAGISAADTVAITISNVAFVNQAPVASAGADRFVAPGATVVLTGGMSDPNAGDFTFGRWTQPAGAPVGGTASGPAGGSRATRTFVVPDVEDGTAFTFAWTVRDNHGLPNSLTVDAITVIVDASTGPQPVPEPEQPPQPMPSDPQPQQPTSGQPQAPGPNQPQTPPLPPAPTEGELDSDGDGVPDRIEILLRSDPFDANSLPSFDISQLLRVRRVDGANELSWSPGLSLAAGYQLWNSNSPYVLLATVDGAGNTTYTHDSATAKETTKYKLTFFIEKTKAGGFLSDASQLDSLPGWDESSGTSSLTGDVVQAAKAFPWWGYLLMVLVAGLVLVSITVYARFERQKQ